MKKKGSKDVPEEVPGKRPAAAATADDVDDWEAAAPPDPPA